MFHFCDEDLIMHFSRPGFPKSLPCKHRSHRFPNLQIHCRRHRGSCCAYPWLLGGLGRNCCWQAVSSCSVIYQARAECRTVSHSESLWCCYGWTWSVAILLHLWLQLTQHVLSFYSRLWCTKGCQAGIIPQNRPLHQSESHLQRCQ